MTVADSRGDSVQHERDTTDQRSDGMPNETMSERLKREIAKETQERNTAQAEVDRLSREAEHATAAQSQLRERIGTIKEPARFLQEELGRDESRARMLVEAMQHAIRRRDISESKLKDLRLAEEQMKKAGLA
jgi:chromosome segregation ATPase